MQIVSFHHMSIHGPTVGYFDVEVIDGLRLCGLRLIKNAHGEYRSVPPKIGDRRTVSFVPDVASKITDAAVARMTEQQLNAVAI